ncbi:gliding motility-associated C-terminal domain-containing protein [Myroides sp. DW712]|uniref:gliding motility-associated C-terminal domain-containing protein n=1 Tax=Myroides sp. DW712 TaxID=3389800 RepID=UPI00397DC232
MKKYVQVFVCFLVGVLPILGQAPFQNTMVNQGLLIITPEALISTSYDFNNTDTGIVKNDGTTYYYRDFNNDNLYYHSNQTKAQAIFTPLDAQQGHQLISGSRPSDFYDVVLNNPTAIRGFDLKNELNVKGSMEFQEGIIKVDALEGMLTFHQGAQAINPNDRSHAEGYVEKIGKEAFTFPIGDKGWYRYASISAPEHEKEAYKSMYVTMDPLFYDTHNKRQEGIEFLNMNEYWRVDKVTADQGEIMLTLSWDERTTPPELVPNIHQELTIVRWNKQTQQWESQGGIVNVEQKEIMAPTIVEGEGYFTLATVGNAQESGENGEGFVIYNLVTPNADGKNDYFYIENIYTIPNNRVEIYNRWGGKVYETTHYDTVDNVFRGYSEGRVTINKNELLPTGTYYYILTYEAKENNTSSVKKCSGYLHLETN